MSDATTPKGSAGETKTSAEAKRSVDGDTQPADHQAGALPKIVPKDGQPSGEEHAPAKKSREDNVNLQPQDRSIITRFAGSQYVAFWTLVATAFLAGATLVLALATADMARSTRILAGLAVQQAHDTQTALGIANRQATAAETANNLTRSPSLAIVGQTISSPSENTELSGSFLAINTGHSPARDVAGKAQLLISEVDPDSPQIVAGLPPVTGGGVMLFPVSGNANDQNLKYEDNYDKSKITKDIVSDIKEKKKYVFLFSRVDYLDHEGKAHFVSTCTFLRVDKNIMAPCKTGNSFQ